MKHSLLCSAIALSLFGCGGSSSDSQSAPSQPQNTAPSLSGVANNTVKALQSTTVTLEMSDNESDVLTLTIEDKPQWVTVDLSENTATLTLAPDFFDIGSHELALNVSDGELSQAYSLTVEVDDNPEQWRDDISLSRAELRGAWSNSANDFNIVFNGYDAGALIIDDTMKQFDYELNNSATAVNLAVAPALCGPYCEREQQAATLRAVAESDSQLRIHVEGLEQNYTVNMAKRSAPSVEKAYSTDELVLGSSSLGQLEINTESNLEAKFYLPNQYYESAGIVGTYDGEILDVNEVIINGPLSYYSDKADVIFSQHFYKKTSGGIKEITLGRNVNYVEPLFIDDNFIVYDIVHSGEVLSSLDGHSVDDFDGLAPLLTDYASLSAQYRLNQVAPPALSFGDKYIGRLVGEHIINDTVFLKAVEVIFDTATELTIPFTVPHAEEPYELPVTYEIGPNQLTLSYQESEVEVAFFQNHKGDTLIASDMSQGPKWVTPFIAIQEQQPLSMQSFAGVYEHVTDAYYNSDVYYSVFHSDGTLGYRLLADGPLDEVELSGETTHFWGVYDSRVVFIEYDSCLQATNFAECLSLVKRADADNLFTYVQSLTPLATEAESTIFNYSSYYGGWTNSEYDSVSNTAVNSLRQLKKH